MNTFNRNIAVGYSTPLDEKKAQQLAQSLNIPLDNTAPNKILVSADKLMLSLMGFTPLFPNFSLKMAKQYRKTWAKQGLIRAVKPQQGLHVLDLTAGWGKDAFILASFGASVCMLEKNLIISALLEDALNHFMHETAVENVTFLLDFKSIDAIDYLNALTVDLFPDVIYIDPMHPARQKTALVKKNMQTLQALIPHPDDQAEQTISLLNLARTKAKKKTILKWPSTHSPPIPSQHSVKEKTVSFHIYLP